LLDLLLSTIQQHPHYLKKPIFVALDGRSGSGKSWLSTRLADSLAHSSTFPCDAAVIEGDDFYSGGSKKTWDSRSVADNSTRTINWREQQRVLQTLVETGNATWEAFDWQSPEWDSDERPLMKPPRQAKLEQLVILDGVYSSREELSEFFDIRVLLEVSETRRRQQLLARESDYDDYYNWNKLWDAAEAYYFDTVLDRSGIDLILS